MSELWSVAITESDWKWLEGLLNDKLANALGSVHSPDTNEGLTPLPLYADELSWLSSRLKTEGPARSGLAFALEVAVPAPHSVRMAREWSDRNGEIRAQVNTVDPFAATEDERNELATMRRYVEQYSAGAERVTEVQDTARFNVPSVPDTVRRWRDNLVEIPEDEPDYPDHYPFEG